MSKTSNRTFWEGVANFMAFMAVIAIGVALMLGYVIKSGKFTDALYTLAQVLAYLVVAYYSLLFVLKRPSRPMLIGCLAAWSVAVVLIVVFMIL